MNFLRFEDVNVNKLKIHIFKLRKKYHTEMNVGRNYEFVIRFQNHTKL
jgi:hypothetical protein